MHTKRANYTKLSLVATLIAILAIISTLAFPTQASAQDNQTPRVTCGYTSSLISATEKAEFITIEFSSGRTDYHKNMPFFKNGNSTHTMIRMEPGSTIQSINFSVSGTQYRAAKKGSSGCVLDDTTPAPVAKPTPTATPKPTPISIPAPINQVPSGIESAPDNPIVICVQQSVFISTNLGYVRNLRIKFVDGTEMFERFPPTATFSGNNKYSYELDNNISGLSFNINPNRGQVGDGNFYSYRYDEAVGCVVTQIGEPEEPITPPMPTMPTIPTPTIPVPVPTLTIPVSPPTVPTFPSCNIITP